MRQSRREASGCITESNIGCIRAVEDTIRATTKYTEGIRTMRAKHPVQGGDFPSKVFSKYYEVYPEIELSWDMPAGIALDWLWQDTPCLDVVFWYDYRKNIATVTIMDGAKAKRELVRTIQGFGEALEKATENKMEVAVHG